MAIKIDSNMSAVAHHIIDGPVDFPYAIDAKSAVSRFPGEWSHEPWSHSDMVAAREKAGEPAVELTPEEQAAIDEHAKAVAEANDRLTKFRAEQEEKRKIAEQVKADEALVASAPPVPVRRPFGRTGEPTAAEIAAAEKRAAKKADDERLAREKAELDAQNDASRQGSG
jgi:hypothetical protein